MATRRCLSLVLVLLLLAGAFTIPSTGAQEVPVAPPVMESPTPAPEPPINVEQVYMEENIENPPKILMFHPKQKSLLVVLNDVVVVDIQGAKPRTITLQNLPPMVGTTAMNEDDDQIVVRLILYNREFRVDVNDKPYHISRIGPPPTSTPLPTATAIPTETPTATPTHKRNNPKPLPVPRLTDPDE